MREEFVRRVLAKEKSKAALCREYGISRPTGDKWLRRYQENQPLSDRSRAPKTQPGRIAPESKRASFSFVGNTRLWARKSCTR